MLRRWRLLPDLDCDRHAAVWAALQRAGVEPGIVRAADLVRVVGPRLELRLYSEAGVLSGFLRVGPGWTHDGWADGLILADTAAGLALSGRRLGLVAQVTRPHFMVEATVLDFLRTATSYRWPDCRATVGVRTLTGGLLRHVPDGWAVTASSRVVWGLAAEMPPVAEHPTALKVAV
jgi:hypothetical protein